MDNKKKLVCLIPIIFSAIAFLLGIVFAAIKCYWVKVYFNLAKMTRPYSLRCLLIYKMKALDNYKVMF